MTVVTGVNGQMSDATAQAMVDVLYAFYGYASKRLVTQVWTGGNHNGNRYAVMVDSEFLGDIGAVGRFMAKEGK